MREYDDDIRAYTPILQRIIILVAVIIAVPVVLWTITSFVRTYVGPPQIPTFQHMTAVQPSDSAADTPASNPAPSVASNPTPPPPAGDQIQTGNTPAAAPPTNVAPSGQPANAAPAQPFPASLAPMAAAPPGAAPPSADGGSPPADRPFVWPNSPTATTNNTAANSTSSDAQLSASSNDSSDALPAVPPIKGPVPLPRRRPNVVAMIEPAQASAPPAGVPLPRARPADAPATSADTPNDVPTLDRDLAH